jgi:hypothetical protein
MESVIIPFEDIRAKIRLKYQNARVELTGRSTASGSITANETSSEEDEVTTAASSIGLRAGTGARYNMRRQSQT